MPDQTHSPDVATPTETDAASPQPSLNPAVGTEDARVAIVELAGMIAGRQKGATAPPLAAEIPPPVSIPGRISRRFLGYDRAIVDRVLEDCAVALETSRQEHSRLREQLARTHAELSLSRTETAWWRRQREQVDTAIAKAHGRAMKIEQAASGRARQTEQQARAHAHQLINAAQAESRRLVESARREAQTSVKAHQPAMREQQHRLQRLSEMQMRLSRSVRTAIDQFQQGLSDLEVFTEQLEYMTDQAGSIEREATGRMDAIRETEVTPETEAADETSVDLRDAVRIPLTGAATSESSRPRMTAPDAATSASTQTGWTVNVGPVADFTALARLQRIISHSSGVTSVYVRSFDRSDASLQVQTHADCDLAEVLSTELEAEQGLTVSGDGDNHVLDVRVTTNDSEAAHAH